ncbi:MAG: hypothetical protein ACOX0A_07080 [Thermoguttaceae bacterium]|jgi:hypothetical protein
MRNEQAWRRASATNARASRVAFCVAAAAIALCVAACVGCASGVAPGGNAVAVGAYEPDQPNPLFVETQDADALWDAIVDVVDNYFIIDVEQPMRTYERYDSTGRRYLYRTEGRLETKPSIMGGVQEPWRQNRAEGANRWFATFQTVRSSAVVRVVPEGEGFFVYLSVFDEIEDMPRPMGASVGYNLKFRDDVSQLSSPVGERAKSKGWIPVGRDDDLERRMMNELAWRVGTPRTVIHAGVDSDLVP